MTYKIVADSSANLPALEGVSYASVPLKIVTAEREYVDNTDLDVRQMLVDLETYKGKSGSSCPSVGDWLEAFGDADCIFTLAITRNLSGSHNAALQAKVVYEEENPGKKVFCVDTLNTGPAMALMVEKLRDLIAQGLSYDEIVHEIQTYNDGIELAFMLSSVDNLAKNGRVSPLIAKAVGILGIRIVGRASDEGTFQQEHKCRGEKKGIETLLKEMKDQGFHGGRVRIDHVCNEVAALALRDMILAEFPGSDISVGPTGALCSFYAEKGGLMVGFHK